MDRSRKMSAKLTYGDFEYALVTPDDDYREFAGYREGMTRDADGQITSAGVYVVGSNNGWCLVNTRGDVSLYARAARREP
jgi:hypothetical protein